MAKKTLAAHDFIALWRSGACDDAAHEQLATILRRCPLSGRLDHGYSSDTGFGEFLSDRWKRLSWVFGPAALGGFMGKSARDICVGLGFGEEWLRASLATGKRFKLAIFPTASVDCQPATWAGVEHLMRSVYPEVWESKIERHFATIRHTPISEIEAQAGYDMEQVNLAGRNPATGESKEERYMTLRRLQEREGSLVQVRQFLWDEIGLKKLYTGDGYTRSDDGTRGPAEFLCRNLEISQIAGAAVIDVQVDL